MLLNGTKVVDRSKDKNRVFKNKDGRISDTFPLSACAKNANTVNRTLALEVKRPELEDNHSFTCLLLLLRNTGP
jgi:hypothetical protein